MEPTANSISSLMHELRRFPPPQAISEKAHVKSLAEYQDLYERSIKDPDGFWLEMARSFLTWSKEPTIGREYEWDTDRRSVWHRWFADGQLNVSYNCLDRHLATRGGKAAIIWQGDVDDDTRVLTYADLYREVCKFGNVLKGFGVKKGDRVCLYLPMVPELPVAMLACARLGAVHGGLWGVQRRGIARPNTGLRR